MKLISKIKKQGTCGFFCFKYWIGSGCDDCLDGLTQTETKELTDDEIKEWLKFEHIPMGMNFKEGTIEGAKWYRDRNK